jgi:5'-phosphate synthase pdxT subunit
MRVGVLALQGDVREHLRMVEALGHVGVAVKYASTLEEIDALIIPGGESTTIGKLADRFELLEPLQKRIHEGLPTLGTCAGMIFLASRTTGDTQHLLELLDVTVERNAFGRQVDSFETDLEVKGLDELFGAVFIRAPAIVDWGDDVEVLATVAGRPVLIRQGHIMAAAFHPELTADDRIHQMFLSIAEED